ncbi:AbrB/MazE/SpoVT family DNA-binding domain-containing protein [Candidatus Gottesmanbacteria bacterium]|nr:AbrB/MazE/SpoVT family DNA-binding domain-containing protein [Candidatus Gottesmanbacteria bacterium]
MNIGIIATPNQKGQIVIPKKYRDQLGITPHVPLNLIVKDNALHIYPIRGVETKPKISHAEFLKILKRTQGAWADDTTWDETRRRRRKIELAASERRKKAW